MKKFMKNLAGVAFVLGAMVTFGGQAFAAVSAPDVTAADAVNVTSTSATLTGSVNPNGATTSAWFEIKNGASSSHQNIGSGNTSVNLSPYPASNLNPNSNFQFRIVATNAIGTTYSSWVSFTTLPANNTCPPGQVGTPPNCTTPSCPPGQVGTPPNCSWPQQDEPTVNLTANPSVIQQGQSSTLSWSVTNATSCFATGGWSGNKNKTGGSQTVTPAQTTTYSLTCTGPGGTASDSATVVVDQVQQNAPTVNLTANPSNIQAGQSSTLSWTVSNATSCVASNGWSGSKNANSGSMQVFPTQTTTYTLTCTGPGGSASDTATVVVNQVQNPPTVTLTANPTFVSYNGSTTLTWSVQNATSCVANSNPGTAWTGNKNANGGSQTISGLTSTTFFNIFCTGPGGSDSATVTVTVGNQPVELPTVTLTANPTNVTSGGSTYLTWNSNNATSCSASSSPYNSQWSGNKSVSGNMQVSNLFSTTTFSLTCTNGSGSASDSVTVSVQSQPQNQLPVVSTYTATSITTNSAVLNGYVDLNGSTGTHWFEWGTSYGYLPNTTNRVYQGSNGTSISEFVSGLPANTTVYFRAAANNNAGTTYGNVLSFVTTGNIITNPCSTFGACLPTAVTTFATNIGNTSARLNGLGLQNGTNLPLNGYFEWGTTQALGNTTPTNFIGSGSSNAIVASLFGLRSGTTYYYRAVVTNQNGAISRGDIVLFRTGAVLGVAVATTANPSLAYRETTLVTNTNTNTITTGVSKPSLVFLDTNCNNQVLRPGDVLECTVHWKNVSSKNITDSLLRVGFPQELEFLKATTGNFSPVDNAVVVQIGNLAPGQEGSMTFTTQVRTDAELGKIIVVASNLVYSYIGDNGVFNQEEVFSYSEHTISGNNAGLVAGATIFSGAFMPNSLAGWLLLLLLILLVLLAAKMVYSNTRPHVVTVPPASNTGMH